MFSGWGDRKYIKEPWVLKCVYSVCVGVIIFVSALLLAGRKLITGCCGALKTLLSVLHVFSVLSCRAGINCFVGCTSAALALHCCKHTCMFLCPEQASKLVMHACHLLHASSCTKEPHMTSI